MEPVSREQIAAGLTRLGVRPGMTLLVHASLSSLGRVDGGADAVIDALLDALGAEGTLLMPTHPARDGKIFDPDTVPSDMGLITETFRLRPGVRRSRHPYHPVAASGPQAAAMLRDHERSRAPDGPETPYGRLIAQSGWVLHVGCDLDTLTLLHTIEAELDLPYLRELTMRYVDGQGVVRALDIERCPGGHRGGVLKFDRLFRREGAMQVGRIGQAVCRLIDAPAAAEIMRRELARDPFFALDDNPHCVDCRRFRGQIYAGRLARESFRLTVLLRPGSDSWEAALAAVQAAGIRAVELEASRLGLTPAEQRQLAGHLVAHGLELVAVRDSFRGGAAAVRAMCRRAGQLGAAYLRVDLPFREQYTRAELVDGLGKLAAAAAGEQIAVLVGNRAGSYAETPDELQEIIAGVNSPHLAAAFAPAEVARVGQRPFYGGLYRGPLRRFVRHVDLVDVAGANGAIVPVGRGNAELVEIVSNLRCRSYPGIFCLWPLPDGGPEGIRLAAEAFWRMMDSI